MNKIILKGIIRNIQYSHNIGDIEYNKADLIVSRDGREDILSLRFKKFSNHYTEGQEIELVGNIRSYSQKLDDGKNKITLYVFTYFDIPEVNENDEEIINEFNIDGRICKMEELRTTVGGKHNIHFILANNILSKRVASSSVYLPQGKYGLLLFNVIGIIKSVTTTLNTFWLPSVYVLIILVVPFNS